MCRKIISWVVFYLLLANGCGAQILRRPAAVGTGAYSLHHVDAFSFISNQASLAQLKNTAAGVYAERRFLLNELTGYNTVAGITTSSGNFGIEAGYSGFSDYNETKLGLAYGRKLGGKVDIGVQFNYQSIRIPSYGNASAISFELGTVLHLTEKLHAGIHANNPVGGKFGKEQSEKLPAIYTVGFGYEASEKFFVSAEMNKEEDQPVNVNVCLQYRFIPPLQVSGGIASATSTAWIGAGLFLKSFRVDVTTSYHPQLGITPGVLLLFHFNKKEQ